MSFPNSEPVRDDGALSRDGINRAADSGNRADKLTVESPLEIKRDGRTTVIRDPRRPAIWAKITGPLSGGTAGQYAGVEQTTDDDGVPSDLISGITFDENGFFLYEISGDPGVAMETVVRAFPSDDGPCYLFRTGGGGGSDITARIDGQFVKDTNPPVSSPSPVCYYPATTMTLPDKAGWVATTTIWVVFWYTYGDVDNGAAPATVVIVDGTAACAARSAGFSYAPNDGGVTPHSGESRPVYVSTDYARVRRVVCDGDGPDGLLGGS